MIFNLRPLHYDKMELIPALTNYLKSYETQYRIKTAFSVTGDETILFPHTRFFVPDRPGSADKRPETRQGPPSLGSTGHSLDLLQVTISDNGIRFDMDAVLRDPEKWDPLRHSRHPGTSATGGREATIDSKERARHADRVAHPVSRQGDDSSWKN